ncbi:hypothetical protein VKT23_019846 [Stygiomarasmius scandens]|uniref:Uncharacterized protein n=1 Tax=Marasmiellus scandens TaxID=2682957 RepID=A0ABR1IKU7_9AGAR
MSNRRKNPNFSCQKDAVIHFVQPDKYNPVFWSSLNSNSLPQVVPDYNPDIPLYTRLPSFRVPRWGNNLYPFLALVPVRNGFDGNLFSRLIEARDPVRIGIRYRMHPIDVGRWRRLENNLLDISSFLMQRAGLPNTYQYLWLPQSLGYDGSFREPEHVRSCTDRTRSAFIFLMALCSFAVAMNLQESDVRYPDEEPLWAKACRLEKNVPVHPQWLADFRKSIVCDFTPGLRVGGFFHAFDSEWACSFPALARANIPFWIWWGQGVGTLSDKHYMPDYMPNPKQRSDAMKKLRVVPETEDHDGDAPMTFTGSYQVRGETYAQFHGRLEEEAKFYEGTETPEDKREREDRTRRARLDNISPELRQPSVGLAMYEWVWYGRYILRKLVSRREWKGKWTSTPSVYRRYIAHLDQWDIEPFNAAADNVPQSAYREGGDSIWVPDSYYDNAPSDSEAGDSSPVSSVVPSQPNPAPSSVNFNYIEDVREMFGSTMADASEHQVQSVFDVMRFRLGFCPPVPFVRHERFDAAQPNSYTRTDANHALFAVGLRNAMEFRGNASAQNNVYRDFIHSMYNYCVSTNAKFFSPLFDFPPSMLNNIKQHSRWNVSSVYLNSVNLPISTWQSDTMYIVGVKDDPLVKQWYLLGLYDATTVLQLFRQNPAGDMGIMAAVRELLRWGVPFITLKPLKNAPVIHDKQRSNTQVGLGVRVLNHQFDAAEYAAYESAKNDVLLSSNGRLALMQGGILWRLAKDIIPSRTVTSGPRSSVKHTGKSFGSLQDHELCEEVLTENEVNVIVGLYKVDTETKNQVSDMSWWPKPVSWAKGNRNFGFWSADDEKFYQERLTEIRNGTARPKTASQWYKMLHGKSDVTAAFYRRIEEVSGQLLDGQSSLYWDE